MIKTIDVSDKVLAETPAKGLKFLGAAGTNRYIRAALADRGYTQAVHQKGFDLVFAAVGYRPAVAPAFDAPEAAAALAEVDAWDEPNFHVASVALAADFPDQHAFLFDGLEPQKGAAAVGSVKLFLDRLDQLESGKDRKATHKADLAALAKLADRKITKAERARLRELLAVVQGGISDEDAAAHAEAAAPADAEEIASRTAALRALRGWYVEWSEIAKVVIKRRDYLIQLGVAKRKKAEKGAGAAPDA